MFTLHTIDEFWNCYNPRQSPEGDNLLCNWDEDDFYKGLDGNYYPYLSAKEDNYSERNARIRYWQKKQQDKK